MRAAVCPSRRAAVGRLAALLAAAAICAAPWGGALAQSGAGIIVVDLSKVVENSTASRALERAEAAARAAVEKRLEAVKLSLETRERELTELRSITDPVEFAEMGAAFDRRVREERRAAQERGALLLRFLDQSREALRAQLPRALEELRRRAGAAVVLDASAAAAWDPDADATAEAAELFDRLTADLSFEPPPRLLEP